MAARRNSRRFVSGSRRAPTSWSRTVSVDTLTVAAGTKAVLTTLTLSNPGIGETIRRTRGTLFVRSDQIGAVEEQFGAFGQVVVSDLAIAAGAASIPGPVTDAGDDGWFLWGGFLNAQNSAATQIGQGGGRFDFDSKAMRRIEEGFGAVFMVENASATDGIQVAVVLSTLSSLS